MAEEPAPAAEQGSQETPSLFPLFNQQSTSLNPSNPEFNNSNSAPQWHSFSSFTVDLSVINEAVSSRGEDHHADIEEDDGQPGSEVDANRNEARVGYQLVESSASDDGDSESGKKRRRKRKKRNRPYDFEYGPASRKPDVQSWAKAKASSSSSANKEYYFDSRGDRDNLAFGSLYKMDVARYKPYQVAESYKRNYYALNRWEQRVWTFEGDNDVNGLDNKLKSEGRYWSAKYAALERHKTFKRMRIVAPKESLVNVTGDFISLSDDQNFDASAPSVVEESWEDEVLRKTREFNKITREQPYNEKAWLEFAEFQDKVASKQTHKGARLQTLEKKISILEKAAELNPDNEELLICLMNAYQRRDSSDILIGRWEKILMKHSGSYKLWSEFLHVVQGDFSRFRVSEIRKMYASAIRSLFSACSKQHRQFNQTATASSPDPVIIQQELGLVNIFLGLCRFEWQTGYQELATALFQAEIEYSLFCPSLLLTEQGKRRLFDHFWSSTGARVGEDEAFGWAAWLEKEEEQRQKVVVQELSSKLEEGGWSGWFELKSTDNTENPENISEAADNFEAEDGVEDIEKNDDTEALMKLLGISTDAEADGEVKDTTSWSRWSEEELSRESTQWLPVRPEYGISSKDGTEDGEGNEELLRVILFEDVSEYLFSLSSEEARLSLVFQLVEFFGGRISQWSSTNSSSWAERTLSLQALPYSFLDDLRRIHDILRKTENNQTGFSLEYVLGSSDDIPMRTGMMRFLRNAALLCLTIFPQNYILKEAALVAEELFNTRMSSSSCSATPCRSLAKSLLKRNRQDVLLCGVYAQREAIFGNINHARKVFDMALSSIEGLPWDSQSNAPLLFFWYAEVELTNSPGNSSEAVARALHILSCLGCGTEYSSFKCKPSSLQQLRALQGFKERIRMLHATWTRGVVDDNSIALICSAALFEELTTNCDAALEIFNQAFSMVLPERRSQSYRLEYLFNFYLRMLWKHHSQSKLLKVWESVVQGLQIYPFSSKLYSVFVEVGHFHTTPNKLRWMIDDYFQKKPSVTLSLFALSFEISRESSHHRVHGLFERALADKLLMHSVLLWRLYLSYELNVACNISSAKRVYFRAIHACPWSKRLWLDGFQKLYSVLTLKELSDLQEVMREKELNLRTDIYEILLQDETEP